MRKMDRHRNNVLELPTKALSLACIITKAHVYPRELQGGGDHFDTQYTQCTKHTKYTHALKSI
jgi:hypothetical protein